jgi:pimeloyl-ACP methyl ester carboxylesterase
LSFRNLTRGRHRRGLDRCPGVGSLSVNLRSIDHDHRSWTRARRLKPQRDLWRERRRRGEPGLRHRFPSPKATPRFRAAGSIGESSGGRQDAVADPARRARLRRTTTCCPAGPGRRASGDLLRPARLRPGRRARATRSVYTIQRSVDELDAVRSALGLDRVVLLGHSWGALLAVEYLCQGRGRGVERLILSGAMASIPQVMAGFDRLFATMPDGFAAKIRGLEKAGKTGTPEYAELVQAFYDAFVLRRRPAPTPWPRSTRCPSRSPTGCSTAPTSSPSSARSRLGPPQGSQGDHPEDPDHHRRVRRDHPGLPPDPSRRGRGAVEAGRDDRAART